MDIAKEIKRNEDWKFLINNITYYPPCVGIYGERFLVSDKYGSEVLDLFKKLSLWGGPTDKIISEEEYSFLFELPLGETLKENPLLVSLIVKLLREAKN